MKKTVRQSRIRRKLAALAVAACFAAPGALANPTGANVVRGAAAIHQAGNLLQITNSPNAIINWQSFSIGAGETTRFIQQSPASAVLNRVVGVDPSSILGALQSNGRIFLINPNGILFGAGARIDVGGLVASTLRLSDEDFLGGRLNFQADPAKAAAAVVNQGRITASEGGRVYLIGAAVENQGVITAPNGDVVLAAGNSVRVTESAGSPLQVEITAPADRAVNLSEAVYGSRGMYGGLVRNSGVINADSAVQTADGRIILKASTDLTLEATSRITANGAQGGSVTAQAERGTLLADGTIEATGSEAKGGRIELLGEQVGLINAATVDASGKTGGGTVLVGGDYQGGNPEVQNAKRTFVGREVEIRADAGEKGDGGKVVVWADDTTRYYGTIGARGGPQGGDGGFVEVSGKQSLEFDGTVNTSAPRGATGTLLLDPSNITISTAANANMTAGPTFTALAATGTLNTGTLQTSLATNNVIVDTTSGSASAGNITVANAVTWASTQSLTLQAHNNITVNAGATITATGGGAITMTADQDLSGAGALTINANVSSTGGAISLSGVGATIAAATTVNSGAGNLTVNARTGTLTTNVNSLLLTIGTATVIADGATINTASSQIGGTGAGVGSAARAILRPFTPGTTIGLAGGAGTLNLTAAELARVRATDVRIGDSTSGNLVVNAWTPAATFAPGVLTLQTGGAVTQGGVINLATSTSDLVLRAGGNITLGSANVLGSVAASSTAGAISLTNAANNTFTVTSLTDDIGALSGISGLNAVTMTTSGTGGINVQQPINTTNAAISLASGSGGINLSTGTADLAPGSGNVTLDAGTGLFNMAAGSSIVTSGNVTVSANTIGLAGLVQATGPASVVKLAPDTAATAVNLGAGAAAAFALTDAELNTIEAPIVRIGDGTGAAPYAGATSGAIAFTGGFTPDAQFGTNLFELRTTGAITATAGALDFGTSGGNLVARSGGSINLGTAAHDFNTMAAVSSVAASTITVRDGVNGMTVGTVDGVAGLSTGSGSITVQAPNGLLTVNSNVAKSVAGAGQAISLSGNGVAVAGAVTVNARAGDATLDAGAGPLTTGAATLVLTTAAANLVGDAMALNATSQFGGTAAGTGSAATATLRQSTNGTTLGLAGGTGTLNLDATELATVRATTVRMGDTNSGAMEIGAWTPTATFAPTVLGLASGAGITQTGAIDLATSTSDLLVRGAGNVVLTNTNNNFANIAASKSAGSFAVTNRPNSSFTVTSLNDGLGAAAGITAPGGVALTTSGTSTITVAQPISTANAAISLTSGSGGVTLNGANSDLASGAGDVTIDAGTGLFNMAAGSSIVTSGNVTVSSNTIALAGLVQATGPASVVKLAPDTAATAINLGAGAAAGFALTNAELNTIQSPIVRIGDGTGAAPYAGATSGNITISGAFASAATFATSFLELRTTGTVTATAAAVNLAAGTTDLVVRAGGVVNIANAGHDLQTVAVTATNSAVTLTEGATGMTVGTVDGLSGIAAGSGSIAVTSSGLLAVNDNVTRTGAGTIALTGVGITQGVSSTIGGGAGTVTLDANDGAYNLAGSITTTSAAANAVQVLDASSAVLGNISATAGGVVLGQAGANNLSGAVSQSGGTSIQSAQLSVAGGSTVTLGAAANDFTGTVTIASGTDVTINDASALSFGASTVSGNLSVTAAAAITDSGNLSVTGTTTLTAGAANITLDNANNFGGSVSVVSANNVTLNDINTLDLGSISTSGSLSATAAGAINQSGVAVVGGNLSMTAAGAITQTASSTVGGTTSLTTNVAGADVLFNDPANQLGGNVSVSTTGAGSDADIRGTGGLAFAASGVGGSFTAVATTGNLTLNGAITAGATGDSIVLATPGNFVNNAGGGVLAVPGGGRWLVYSTNPELDTRGGLELAYAFKHYGLTYTGPYGGPGTGNGLIYSTTPNITPSLGGSASRGYDGTNVAPTGSLAVAPTAGDVIDADTVTLALTGATYDTKHVGTAKLVDVSGISIATQTNAGRPVYGYTTNATASANVGTIIAAPLTVTAQTDSRGYNGTTSSGVAPVVTGTLYDAVGTAAVQSYDTKHAGTGKTLTPSGFVANDGNGGGNYSITYVADTTGVITAASLTVTAQTDNRGYNGTTSSAVAPVVTGAIYDPVGTAATQSYDTKNVGAGKTLTASGLLVNDGNSGNNYAITYVTDNTGLITAAPLTVTAQTDTRGYNGTTSSAVAPVVTGTLYDPVGTAATQSYDTKNAGAGKTLTASGLAVNDGNGGANYAITYVTDNTGVITAAPLTVTAQADSRGYNGTTSSAVAPVVTGTLYDGVGTVATQSYDTKHVATGKTLTPSGLVVNDGNNGNNYAVTYVADNTGVITAAPLTVTAQTDSRGYNGTTNSAVAPVITGTVYDGVGTAAAQSFDTKHVGTGKTLTASGLVVNDGNSGNNYAITYVTDNTGLITAAPLTVTAQTDTRGYNGTTSSAVAPVITGTVYDGVGTAATQSYDTKHVGTGKTLTPSGLVVNDGNSGNNYAITYVTDNTGVITAAPLTVTAQTDSRGYNGTTSSAVAPVVTGTLYDAVGTAPTQSYDTKNAGTGKTLTASGLAVNDGNSGNNYAVTYVTDNAGVIATAALLITADNASRPANQPNPPFSATYSGFQFGETPAALTGTLSFTTPATAGSPAGTYAITPFGQSSTNYAIAYLDGTLTVSAAPLSPAAFVNPLIPAVNYWVPDPQAVASSTPAVVAMDSSLTPLPATAAGPVGGAQPAVAASGAPVALAMDESLTPPPPTAAGPVGGAQPAVAASGAPVALAMDESLTPPTVAGENAAAPTEAQPRRIEDNWKCFRHGSFTSRNCR